ncbi:MAG: choice-of-anchor Q domain-containing protein, partial [Bacteroidota bacterium]
SDARPLDLTGTTTDLMVTLAAAAAPTASFTVSEDPQAAAPITFDGAASTGDGPLTYAWTFETDDATRRGGGEQVSQLFAEGGDVRVTLTVASRFGATASTSRTVSVGNLPAPVAQVPTVIRVVDTRGARVSEAHVEIVGATQGATANALGEAAFAAFDVGVPRSIRVSADGYAAQTVPVTLPEGTARGFVSVTLLPRASARSMADAELGGAMMAADGAMVALPVEGLIDAAGNPVSGAIDVFVTPVDVADADERAGFPGQFAGVQPNGDRGIIASYGTVEYVFEQDGQELQLAPGKSATVEIPIYTGGAEVGDTIALWSVDEETGLWVQEGTGIVVESDATPNGLALRAEVTHFSWWNADKFEDSNPETGLCWENQCSSGVCQRVAVGCWTKGGRRDATRLGGAANEEAPVFEVRTFIPEGGTELELPVNSEVILAATALGENGDLLEGQLVASSTGELVEIDLFPVQPTSDPIPLSFPFTQEGSITESEGGVVVYTFDGQAGTTILLSAVRTGGGDGTFTLRDPDNIAVAGQPYGSANEPAFTVLPKTGTYRLLVAADRSSSFTVTAASLDGSDLGGLPARVTVAFDEPGAVAAFTFEANEGDEAGINVARASGSFRGRYLVRTPSGQLLTEAEFSATSSAGSSNDRLVRFPETGTYRIFVITNANLGNPSTFALSVLPVAPVNVDALNTGSVAAYEVQYLRFDAEPGGYRAFLSPAGSSGWPGGRPAFYDANATRLDVATPFGFRDAPSGLVTITEPGAAYVRVAGSFFDGGGEAYELSLSLIAEPTPVTFDALGTAMLERTLTLPSDIAVYALDQPRGALLAELYRSGDVPLGTFYELYFYEGAAADYLDPDTRINPTENVREPSSDLVVALAAETERSGPLLVYVANTADFGGEDDIRPGTFRLTLNQAIEQDSYVIDDDGLDCPNADGRSLKAALKAAPEGATVTACAGVYASPVDHRFEASNVTLRGTDREAVVVTNGTEIAAPFNAVTFVAGLEGGTIENLTVETTTRNRTPLSWRLPNGTLRNIIVRAADTVGEPLSFGVSTSGDGLLIDNITVEDAFTALGGSGDEVVVRGGTFSGKVSLSGDRNEITGNLFRSTLTGEGIFAQGGALTVADNVMELTPVFSGSAALIVAARPVVSGEDRRSVVRGNRIVTDTDGVQLSVGNAPAALLFEQNFVRTTAENGERVLTASPGRTDGSGSLVVRNNVFDGASHFEGFQFTNIGLWTEPFDFVNNTVRVAPDDRARDTSSLITLASNTSDPGPYLFRMANNVFVGEGEANAIDFFDEEALDVDYNLFFNFNAVFERGSSSTGTNNIVGVDPFLTGDFLELAASSPALDAGATPSQYDAVPADDFDGTARPQGAGYDIGAHERE